MSPVRQELRELVSDLRSSAGRLGCEGELDMVEQVLEGGASYARQRAVAAASGGDLTAVVDSLLAEFDARAPIWLPAREPAQALGEPGAAGATAGGGGS